MSLDEFKLQFPLRPQKNGIIFITQLFGENSVPFYKDMGLKGHNGIDFRTLHYQDGEAPIYAAHDGWVISDKNTQSNTAGRFVKIESDELSINGEKCKVVTVYFHLSRCIVSSTDNAKDYKAVYHGRSRPWVKAGQLIGYGGNTGKYTTGPHLHLGMYILNKKSGEAYYKDVDNGYNGAVNPIKYFKDNKVYQRMTGPFSSRFWFNGKEVKRFEIDEKIDKWYYDFYHFFRNKLIK